MTEYCHEYHPAVLSGYLCNIQNEKSRQVSSLNEAGILATHTFAGRPEVSFGAMQADCN
jgi:hypothetical protein